MDKYGKSAELKNGRSAAGMGPKSRSTAKVLKDMNDKSGTSVAQSQRSTDKILKDMNDERDLPISQSGKSIAEILREINDTSSSPLSEEELLATYLRTIFRETVEKSPSIPNTERNSNEDLLNIEKQYGLLPFKKDKLTTIQTRELNGTIVSSQPESVHVNVLLRDLQMLNRLSKPKVPPQILHCEDLENRKHFDNLKNNLCNQKRLNVFHQSASSNLVQNIPSANYDRADVLLKSSTNESNRDLVIPKSLKLTEGNGSSTKMSLSQQTNKEDNYEDDLIGLLNALEQSEHDREEIKFLTSSKDAKFMDSNDENVDSMKFNDFWKGVKQGLVNTVSKNTLQVAKGPSKVAVNTKRKLITFNKSLRLCKKKAVQRSKPNTHTISMEKPQKRVKIGLPKRSTRPLGINKSVNKSPEEYNCLRSPRFEQVISPVRYRRSFTKFSTHDSAQRNWSEELTLRSSNISESESRRCLVSPRGQGRRYISHGHGRNTSPNRSPEPPPPQKLRSPLQTRRSFNRSPRQLQSPSPIRPLLGIRISPQSPRHWSPNRYTTKSPGGSRSPRRFISTSPRRMLSTSARTFKGNSPIRFTSRSPCRLINRSPMRMPSRSPKGFTSSSPRRLTSMGFRKFTGRSPRKLTRMSPRRICERSQIRFTSKSPRRITKRSPVRFTSRSPRRIARSPIRFTNRSPRKIIERSPLRLTSRSPRRIARSPMRFTSRSSRRIIERSPVRFTSRSPRRTARSPTRFTSKSPSRIIERSPIRFTSISPRTIERSPTRFTSKSPRRIIERSPIRCTSRSPWKIAKSPMRFTSKSPRRIPVTKRSPVRFTSRSPRRLSNRSPQRLNSRSPRRLPSRSPRRMNSRSPRRFNSKSPRRIICKSPRKYRSRSPRKEPMSSKYRNGSPLSYRSQSPSRYRSRSPVMYTISPDRYMTQSPRVSRDISPHCGGMPHGRLRSMSPGRLRSMSPGRLRSMSPGRLRSMSPGRLRSMSPGRLRSMSPGRLRSMSPERLRNMSPERLRSTSPGRLRSMSQRGLKRTFSGRLVSLSPERLPGMSHGRLTGKYPGRLTSTSGRLRSISPGRLIRTPERLQSVSPETFQSLSPGRLRSMSPRRFTKTFSGRLINMSSGRLTGASHGIYRENSEDLYAVYPPLVCFQDNNSPDLGQACIPQQYLWSLSRIRSAFNKTMCLYALQVTQDNLVEDIFCMSENLKDQMFRCGFELQVQVIPYGSVREWKDVMDNLIEFARRNGYDMKVHVEAWFQDEKVVIGNLKPLKLATYFQEKEFTIRIRPETELTNQSFATNQMKRGTTGTHQPIVLEDSTPCEFIPEASYYPSPSTSLFECTHAVKIVRNLAKNIPKPYKLSIKIGKIVYTQKLTKDVLRNIFKTNSSLRFSFDYLPQGESHSLNRVSLILYALGYTTPNFEVVIHKGRDRYQYSRDQHEHYANIIQSDSFPITFIVQKS